MEITCLHYHFILMMFNQTIMNYEGEGDIIICNIIHVRNHGKNLGDCQYLSIIEKNM
jgi:hypothetical protein